jgi:chitin disaccharide deacetylase
MPANEDGLLIVNADDLGLDRCNTDAILECFHSGAISSATALVWMEDSCRAAEMARREGIPVGLHLNLIEPFSAADVPEAVAATQRRVVERLRHRGIDTRLFHPGWSADFERCIGDQLARFHELYGHPPTHIDGHQHMHLVPNALLARALGSVGRCRRPVNRRSTESRAHKRAFNAALARLMRPRFVTTEWCFSIRSLHPGLGGSHSDGRLALARDHSVEVMVHPGWEDERAVLLAPDWRDRLATFRRGSYADLPARRRWPARGFP